MERKKGKKKGKKGRREDAGEIGRGRRQRKEGGEREEASTDRRQRVTSQSELRSVVATRAISLAIAAKYRQQEKGEEEEGTIWEIGWKIF